MKEKIFIDEFSHFEYDSEKEYIFSDELIQKTVTILKCELEQNEKLRMLFIISMASIENEIKKKYKDIDIQDINFQHVARLMLYRMIGTDVMT